MLVGFALARSIYRILGPHEMPFPRKLKKCATIFVFESISYGRSAGIQRKEPLVSRHRVVDSNSGMSFGFPFASWCLYVLPWAEPPATRSQMGRARCRNCQGKPQCRIPRVSNKRAVHTDQDDEIRQNPTRRTISRGPVQRRATTAKKKIAQTNRICGMIDQGGNAESDMCKTNPSLWQARKVQNEPGQPGRDSATSETTQ